MVVVRNLYISYQKKGQNGSPKSVTHHVGPMAKGDGLNS